MKDIIQLTATIDIMLSYCIRTFKLLSYIEFADIFWFALRTACTHEGRPLKQLLWVSVAQSAWASMSAAHAKLPKVKGALYVHGCELSDKVLEDKRERYPGDSVG